MQEFREDPSYFVDDDERVIDETTMALTLLSAPLDLAPEMSPFARAMCYMGIISSAFLTFATFISLRNWLAWSNLLLLAFQLILVVGIWIVLFTYSIVKIVSDNRTRLANEDALEEHQSRADQWFDELEASKRDARMRKNKALDVELRLRETRLPANIAGNRDVIWIPETGQMILPPAGQFIQPVPNSYHYHNQVLPGSVKVTEDKAALPGPEFPAPIKFEEILRSGFTPTAQNIYLLNTVNGSINEAMSEVCHVGLAARTGGGKTNTTRLLTAQFEFAGARVYLASPNFAQLKLNKNHLEDWRPIVQHLAAPPAQSDAQIRTLLLQFRQLFEHRKTVEQRTARRGADVYLVLGEWPGIVKRVKEAPEILELLLRESRQYGIHVVTEFQDALVNTLGVDSGVRENLLHCYYFGGDPRTAKIVLDLQKGVTLNETGLGKYGAAYMRANEKEIVAGRVPHFTNRALYMLLGAPPDPVTDEEIYDESQIPETYYHVDENGQYVDGGAVVDIPEQDSQPSTSQQPFYMPETPRVVDAQRRPFASTARDARPDGGRNQGTSYTRTETQQDEQESLYLSDVEENESAHQNGARQPLDGAHTTQDERAAARYRLDTLQIELFATAYQITGNIDLSLEHAGANTRYREHAREIIRERNLKKRES
jgi:hypothetical protein